MAFTRGWGTDQLTAPLTAMHSPDLTQENIGRTPPLESLHNPVVGAGAGAAVDHIGAHDLAHGRSAFQKATDRLVGREVDGQAPMSTASPDTGAAMTPMRPMGSRATAGRVVGFMVALGDGPLGVLSGVREGEHSRDSADGFYTPFPLLFLNPQAWHFHGESPFPWGSVVRLNSKPAQFSWSSLRCTKLNILSY
jgi:hypothetical protein